MLSRSRIIRAACFISVAGILAAPSRADGQSAPEVRQQAREVSSSEIATQLGVKLPPGQAESFSVGSSLTGVLTDNAALARMGLKGTAVGARITISRIAPQRVRVESDEVEPVPRSRVAHLRMDGAGRLSPEP